ncbi:MAG: hypothetical protein GXO32_05020 [Crenarchaeota archaeon]|nr:hypothetical protein [Thermoproteota archaeon]
MILRLRDLVRLNDENGRLSIALTPMARDLMKRFDYFDISIEHGEHVVAVRLTDSEEAVIVVIERWFGRYAMVVDAYYEHIDYMVVPVDELMELPVAEVGESLSVGVPASALLRYGLGNVVRGRYDVVKVMKLGSSRAVPVKTIELGKYVKRYVIEAGRIECFEALR